MKKPVQLLDDILFSGTGGIPCALQIHLGEPKKVTVPEECLDFCTILPEFVCFCTCMLLNIIELIMRRICSKFGLFCKYSKFQYVQKGFHSKKINYFEIKQDPFFKPQISFFNSGLLPSLDLSNSSCPYLSSHTFLCTFQRKKCKFHFQKFSLANKIKPSKEKTRNIMMAVNSPKDNKLST